MTHRSIAMMFALVCGLGAQAADGFYVGAANAHYSITTGLPGPSPGAYPQHTYPVCGGTASYRLGAPEFETLTGDVAANLVRVGWRTGDLRFELELAPELTLEQSDTWTPNFRVVQATCVPPAPTTTIAPSYYGLRRYSLEQTVLAASYRVLELGRGRLEFRLQAASWRRTIDHEYTHSVAESVGGIVTWVNIIEDDRFRATDDGIGFGFGVTLGFALFDGVELELAAREQDYGDASSSDLTLGFVVTF